MLYKDFCQVAFEDECCHEYYTDYIEDTLSDLDLGIMYGELPDHEASSDKNYMLCMVAQAERSNIIAALTKDCDLSYLVIEMKATASYNNSKWRNIFEKHRDEDILNALANEVTYGKLDALAWLQEDAYLVGYLSNNDND